MSESNKTFEWRDTALSDLCTLATDSSRPSESGAPIYVGLEHIESGAFRLNNSAPPADFKSNSYRFARGDDLYGKLRPYLDKAIVAPSDGVCSTEILVLRPRPQIAPEFILAILHSPEFIAYSQSSADKQYPRTSWSWISQYTLRLPCDPTEQRAIADILSKVQEALETEGQLSRVTRELKQAALRQLFTRGLRGEPQKETDIGLVPESWDVLPVADCVMSFRFNRSQQIPASQYANAGRFAIVDQGQAIIAGYCDDEVKVIRPDEPLVIFGDHTRCLKFVDFPFVLGADGTKPLLARPEWDTKALFYALSAVKLESRGYNRHFKHFSEKLVARPKDKDEQRKIAALLGTIDAKLAHHEARQKLLRELFRTLLHDLMTARRRVTGLIPAMPEAKL